MDELNLFQGRRMAENYLDDQMRSVLAQQQDEDVRRLLETLYARQKGSMEYLSLIHLDEGASAESVPEAEEDKRILLMGHPASALLLGVVVMTFVLFDWEILSVLTGILLVLQCFLRLVHPTFRRASQPALPEVHEPYVRENEMKRFLQKQADRIAIDAASIAERQQVTLVRERQDVGEDAVDLYCAIAEAAVELEDPEILAYPLSILKMSLLERGLEPVDYTPETAAFFDVMPADCPAHMSSPAIRQRDNGVVIRRGLYLRSQRENTTEESAL